MAMQSQCLAKDSDAVGFAPPTFQLLDNPPPELQWTQEESHERCKGEEYDLNL